MDKKSARTATGWLWTSLCLLGACAASNTPVQNAGTNTGAQSQSGPAVSPASMESPAPPDATATGDKAGEPSTTDTDNPASGSNATSTPGTAGRPPALTDALLESLLKDQGMGSVELLGEGKIFFLMDGQRILLLREADEDLQLVHASLGAPCNLQQMNDWNKLYRFSRAYIDNDGDTIVESDLLGNGGLSAEKIVAFIQTFRVTIIVFSRYLIDCQAGS